VINGLSLRKALIKTVTLLATPPAVTISKSSPNQRRTSHRETISVMNLMSLAVFLGFSVEKLLMRES